MMGKSLKRLTCLFLTLVMVCTLLPAPALAAGSVDEDAVASLAEVYGDEEQAREDLNALYEAGLIKNDGSLVDLDIRAGGAKTGLDELSRRIAAGESVDGITVNGHDATAEQIMLISQVDAALELARLLDQEIDVTDEHVENLEALLAGIQDGSVDLTDAVERGALQLNASQAAAAEEDGLAMLMDGEGGEPESEPETEQWVDAVEDADIPATGTDQGALTGGTTFNGRYIGSDGTYNTNYSFTLPDETVKNYYTDARYNGMPTLDGTVTVTINNSTSATATLDKAQDVPVYFEWKVGGVANATGGTVRWEAGQSGNRNFSWSLDSNLKWKGDRMVVVNASNLLNATFADGKSSWSGAVAVNQDAKEDELFPGTWRGISWSGKEDFHEDYPYKDMSPYDDYSMHCYYWVKVGSADNGFNTDGKDIYLKVQADAFITSKRNNRSSISLADMSKKTFASQNAVAQDFRTGVATLNLQNTNYASKVSNGQLYMQMSHWTSGSFSPNACNIESVQIFRLNRPTSVSVKSISVPAGEYRTGEMVPVTVEFDQTVKSTASSKLKVNGTDCKVLDPGVCSAKLTFGYTVKENDGVTVNAGEASGFQNYYGDAVTVSNNAGKSIGAAESVFLVTGTKASTVKASAAKWGVDDAAPGYQTMTVVVPLDTSKDLNWVGFEAVDIQENNKGIAVKLPDYGDVELTHYVRGVYFSLDRGLTRYPAYVLTQETAEKPVALVGRFAVPVESKLVRKGAVNLFVYPFTVTENKFLPAWEDAETDVLGYKYFVCGTDRSSNGKFAFTPSDGIETAPVVKDTQWDYYVKGPVYFRDSMYVKRTEEYEVLDGGFIRLTDSGAEYPYVLLRDAEHPDRRYDVELIGNEDFYHAVMNGDLHGDDIANGATYRFSYQISDRKPFTFADSPEFSWVVNEDGIVEVVLGTDEESGEPDTTKAALTVPDTSKTPVKKSTISLRVRNGAAPDGEDNTHTYNIPLNPIGYTENPIGYSDGLSPFLIIPSTSKYRTTLTGTDTDIFFSSNLTQRNQEGYDAGVASGINEASTRFINFDAYVYKDAELNSLDGGTRVTTATRSSTVEEPQSYLTIPGSALNTPGVYRVRVEGYIEYDSTGARISRAVYSDTAWITVKQGPAKAVLAELPSYYVSFGDEPKELRYDIVSGSASTEVEYTIQKAGKEVGERMKPDPENLGFIPFTADAPEGIKDIYTVTTYARNSEEDPWSVDSLRLTVYNTNLLDLIVKEAALGQIGGTTGGKAGDGATVATGQTVTMDNTSKVAGMASGGTVINYSNYGYGSLDEMRADIGLQKIISVNYGSGVWGMLSDRMEWSSSDPDKVSVDYEQGGIYSDIRNYSYTTYAPATDFLLVGKNEGGTVTVTATHAKTGMSASLTVQANTLADKFYVFRFYPQAETSVTYTTAKNATRTLTTNAQGELVVYEPDGIGSPVMAMSTVDGVTYAGTIFNNALETGEKDIAALQLYPCNNLILKPISSATLTFLEPDGTPYNGSVTLRGGVYKNNVYCPNASFQVGSGAFVGLRESTTANVSDGKLTVGFAAGAFSTGGGDSLKPGDAITYVFEYSFDNGAYQPGYVMIHASTATEGKAQPGESVVLLHDVLGSKTAPQIFKQELVQYHKGDNHATDPSNVLNYTENVGISAGFPEAKLVTSAALTGEKEKVKLGSANDNDYAAYKPDSETKAVKLELRRVTDGGEKMLTNQTETSSEQATVVTNLADLAPESNTSLFVFPFSSFPIVRGVYTMTDAAMSADGVTDQGEDGAYEARVRAVFTQNGFTVRTVTLPFGVSNLSHQVNLNGDSNTREMGKEIRSDLNKQTDIGEIFKSIDVNDMIRKGFVFLSMLTGVGGDNPINMAILPTEDPATFRIMAFLGYNRRQTDDDGLHIGDDPEQVREDMAKYLQEMQEDDDDDDEEESNGEGKLSFNFYGALILEARLGIKDGNWKINFVGGNVGTNVKGSYEWSQTFFAGPYPALISFEVGFHADVEVAFGSKNAMRAMLLDAAVGVSIEAFAGLGFDLSIVEFKLGIYGKIGADVNFKLLTDGTDKGTKNGTKLDITGEIGIKFKVKLLFISYSTDIASTSFGWTKKWGKYDEIGEDWKNSGFASLFGDEEYADLMGETESGRPYSMRLFSDGTAIVTIQDDGRIEDRDYLSYAQRSWNRGAGQGGMMLMAANPTAALNNVQTNAYPYAEPTFIDDGEMFLYISDNDNAKKLETVVSYAVKNGSGYDDMGRLDTSEGNIILADSGIAASGTKDNAFAAWVKMMEEPRKEMKQEAGKGDLGMMINATEVYAGVYSGEGWTVERLTENNIGDMSPVVASRGSKAILAWRSLNASSMPKGTEELSNAFDVEDNINYVLYDGTEWSEPQVAYNGSAGSVNAVDAAMLPDGTAILVYTVRTGDEATTTETFYTVVDAQGATVTTGRLTQDDYSDINAQVAAVGDRFVIGWYSEHEAGEEDVVDYDEKGKATTRTAVAHDISLARVDANGSPDEAFPESIGGSAASSIGADFRFSAPLGCTSLDQLSIVWSQRKESTEDSASTRYEISGVRFYEEAGALSVTMPTALLETEDHVTVDEFDAYTGADGAVNAVILASDYNGQGYEVFDTIDLTKLEPLADNAANDAEPSADTLKILEKEPVAKLMLGSAGFPAVDIEAQADFNIYELTPGLSLPVQFTVVNSGTSPITALSAAIGGVTVAGNSGLNLLPGESFTVSGSYEVPEGAVADRQYTVTAENAGGITVSKTDDMILNRPDVGIAEIKVTREQDTTRDVQVILTNASNIPLAGSGKTVRLSFYRDNTRDEDSLIKRYDVPADSYAFIDNGSSPFTATLSLAEIEGSEAAAELPEGGVSVYAYAEVVDTQEPYTYNNTDSVFFRALLEKSDGAKTTEDVSLQTNDDDTYTVFVDIRSNTVAAQDAGCFQAVLLDDQDTVIAQKDLNDGDPVALGPEGRMELSAIFADGELNGKTPVKAVMTHTYKVTFDANGGSFPSEESDPPVTTVEKNTYTDAGLNARLHATDYNDVQNEFIAPKLKYRTNHFDGWYTAPEGGEKVDENTVYNCNTTLYAHYSDHEHRFVFEVSSGTIRVTCVNEDGRCFLSPKEINGELTSIYPGVHTATLTLNPPENADSMYYDGKAHPATLTGNLELVEDNVITYAKKVNGQWRTQTKTVEDQQVPAPPVDAGDYRATFTLPGEGGGGDITAMIEYTVQKRPLTLVFPGIETPLEYTGVKVWDYYKNDDGSMKMDALDATKSVYAYTPTSGESEVHIAGGIIYTDVEIKATEPGEQDTFESFKITRQPDGNNSILGASVPGTYKNLFGYQQGTGTNASNYEVTKVEGDVVIENHEALYEVIIKGPHSVPNSQNVEYPVRTKEYNKNQFAFEDPPKVKDKIKQDQGDDQIIVKRVVNDVEKEFRYTIDTANSGKVRVVGTDVGEYKPEFTKDLIIRDQYGKDATSIFDVKIDPESKLVIKPREITIISQNLEKEYDGLALTNGTKNVTFKDNKGFLWGDGATYAFNGSVTLPNATADNSFVYLLNSGTNRDNYKITKQYGKLKIKPRGADKLISVILTPNDNTVIYNGQEQGASGFTISGTGITAIDPPENKTGNGWFQLENGAIFQLTGMTASVTATNAGTYTYNVTGTPVITDIDGNTKDVDEKDLAAQFNIDTSANGTLTINKRKLTLTSGTATKYYDGTVLTNKEVTVTVTEGAFAEGETPSYTGFVDGENPIYTNWASVLLPSATGPVNNTFDVASLSSGSLDNYEITKVNGKLEITNRLDSTAEGVTDENKKYEITVTANSKEFMYDGTEKSVSGFETLSFTVEENGLTYTVEGLSAEAKGTNAGDYTVAVSGTAVVKDSAGNDVTAQFIVNTVPGTMTIRKRNVTLTSATATKVYDGLALTDSNVTVGGAGWANGEGATYTFTGTQTIVGTSPNDFSYQLNENTSANNYTVAELVKGQLTVTNRDAKYQIAPVANSATGDDAIVYDGEAHTVGGFTSLEFTVENGSVFTVEGLTASGTGTDAGDYTVNVTGTPIVKDSEGNDVSAQFAVVPTPGKLTINKRQVTLTSGTASKAYDGTALTADEVTQEGFVKGQHADCTVTGSRTLPGESDNSFNYTIPDEYKDNYEVQTVLGKLTVGDRTNEDGSDKKYEITVTANSATVTYDGTEHTVSGYTVSQLTFNGVTYTLEGLSASATATDAGETTVTVTGTPVIKIAGGEATDLAKEFIVNRVDGKLTVTPRDVTLTSGSASKTYDGNALTKEGVTVGGDGFVTGEGAQLSATGSQRAVGSSANTIEYTMNDGTKGTNYNITKSEGTLTVTARDAKYEITATANSATVTYDGVEHAATGFLTTTYTVEGNIYTLSGLTAEAKGTDVNTYTSTVTGTAVVTDSDGNDVSDQFHVTPVPGKLTINKRSVTLTSASASKAYDGVALTDSNVTVGGDGWANGEGATYNVSGTRTLVGTAENSFSYELNTDAGTKAGNYNVETHNGTLTVNSRDAKLAVTLTANSGTFLYDGTEKSVNGYSIDGTQGNSFTLENGASFTIEDMSAGASRTNAGETTVNVTGTPVVKDAGGNVVTDQFSVNVVPGKLTVNKRSVTLTSPGASKAYDGTALTNAGDVAVTGDGFASGESVNCIVTGTRTLPGTSDNVFTYNLVGADANNYEITTVYGKLNITDRADEGADQKYEITVTANSDTVKYDGTEHSVSGYTVDKLIFNGVTYTLEGLSASAAATNAGETAVEVTGTPVIKIDGGDGTDLTGQFIVNLVDGKLTIEKRSVTLTSATETKAYDGSALSNDSVEVTGDGFVAGEEPQYTVTGTQTAPGTSENSFSYDFPQEVSANNYLITTNYGTLTVTGRDTRYTVTLTANSGEFQYDGERKSVTGYTIGGVDSSTFTAENGFDYTVSGMQASAERTDAGTVPVNVTGTAVVTDSAGNDVTEQFAVLVEPGTLSISKRNVTLTSETDSKAYDGTALTNSGVTVGGDGFAAGEGAEYTVTGTRTQPGETDNSFDYTLDTNTTKAENYNITKVVGKLTVTDRTESGADQRYEITVTANSDSVKYDGQEHTVSGFETLQYTFNGVTYYVTGVSAQGTRTDVGETTVQITGTPVVKDGAGNDLTRQFIVHLTNGKLTVEKRNVTLTSATANAVFNGADLTNDTVTVTGDGFAGGEGAEYSVTGLQRAVGSSKNGFSYELTGGAKAGNYNITKVEGTLTVTSSSAKYEITPTAKNQTFKYDGQPHTLSGLVSNSFELGGNTFTITGLTATVTATNAGTYPVNVTGTAKVSDADENDVTDQFRVLPVNGTLEITKRVVALTSNTSSKEYDGTALTDDIVTIGGDGFAEGEGADIRVTGTRTLVGTAENSFTYTLKPGTDANNYTIATGYGTLTVRNRDVKYTVTLTGNSAEFQYDGTEHRVTGFSINGVDGTSFTGDNGVTYTVSGMSAEAKLTAVGSASVNVTGTPRINDASGADVTAEFAVSVEPGTLTVSKRSVTLTSATESKVYDGKALTNNGVTVSGDGFADGEGADYNFTGARTLPGEAENVFSYTLKAGTNADNYDISVQYGTLTVTDRSESGAAKIEITVTGNSGTVTYDGEEHTVSGYTVSQLTFNGVTYTLEGLSASGSGTNAGSYAVAVSGEAVVKDSAENDVTDQFDIRTAEGTLTIEKADMSAPTLKLKAANAEEEEPVTSWIYGESAGTVVLEDNESGGAVTLRYTDGTNDYDEMPSDAGSYTVYASVAATANYNGVEEEDITPITFTIEKADHDNESAQSVSVSRSGVTDGTVDLSAELARAESWTVKSTDGSLITAAAEGEGTSLKYTAARTGRNAEGAVVLTVSTRNYNPYELTVPFSTAMAFTLSFETGGAAEIPSRTLEENEAYGTLPTAKNMSRSGYEFAGWYTDPNCTEAATAESRMGSADAMVYAKWTVKSYKVTLDLKGHGAIPEEYAKTVENGAIRYSAEDEDFELPVLADVTESGSAHYSFTGWVKDSEEEDQAEIHVTVRSDSGEDLSYSAVWTEGEKVGEVTFEKGGVETLVLGIASMDEGTVSTDSSETTANAGAPAKNLADAMKEVAGDTEVTAAAADVTVAMEVKPLDVNNAVPGTETYQAIQSTAKSSGSDDEESGVGDDLLDITVQMTTKDEAGDTVTTAISDIGRVVEIPVRYDMTGRYNPQVFHYHKNAVEEFTRLASRPRSGYADGTFYVSGSGAYATVYIYTRSFSIYSISSTTRPTHTVLFETNGGSEIASATVRDQAQVTRPANPTKTGEDPARIYIFDGWYTTGDYAESYDFSTPVSGDVTLYAKWREITAYTITLDANGGTVNPGKAYTRMNGTLAVASLPTPSPSDNFQGWYDAPTGGNQIVATTVFTGDSTIYARWTPGTTPGTTPETTPGTTPETTPGTTPGTAPEVSECRRDESCPMYGINDLDLNKWYHDGVHWALAEGVMKGMDAAVFAPHTATNRAMIVTMLWRMEGSPVSDSAMNFSDVPEDWFTEAIRWASENGIVLGYEGTDLFGPNDAVSREQLAAILYRYTQYKGVDVSAGEETDLESFADAGSWNDWAVPALRWAVGTGIIAGMDDGTMRPRNDATRAQVATMLMRYSNLIK